MTTNGRENPLGIGGQDISLAWSLTAEARDVSQSAYQVRVGTALEQEDVWSSGRVVSDQQIDIPLPTGISLASATRYFWQVKIWDDRGRESEWSEPAWFETGLLSPADWAGAEWITRSVSAEEEAASLPLMRGVFEVSKPIRSARVYATAHGIYELSLNGVKAGDQFLAPGWTDYEQRLQVQTYDVTSLVKRGTNGIGVALADGWYRGKVGLNWTRVYGEQLSFIAKIKLTYADGSMEWIETDANWKVLTGPFVSADLQDGESYDARLEQPGWNTPDFDDSNWQSVAVNTVNGTRLVPQPDEPVRVTEILTARTQSLSSTGGSIYDLGQNMVGVGRITMTGRAGQTVTIRYAEELYRTGERKGDLYTENFRTAKVIDRYTFAADGTVTYQPTFTQHGFRYIELVGLDEAPEVEQVQGVVLGSDLRGTGSLETSNPMLNQLVSNIRWGQRGNFLSIPTDTPARDERLGWTGDINVFAPTANRFQDTRAFLSKWMDDMRDAQKPNGNIPAIVPQPMDTFDETGVGWSDAFITVPYAVWMASGDTQIVRQNWEAMQRFYAFVHKSATHDGNLIEEGRSSWFSGDWLNLEQVDRLEEHKVIATAYFAENTRMMAEMAAVMGEMEKAAEWSAWVSNIRDAFVAAFWDADGSIYTGTQTVYAMALGMDLIADPDQRARTQSRFLEKLAADDHHLRTGFLGTPWLLPALTRIARDDLAMQMLLNESYPSWGFEIRMGATTMWERWNSIRANGEFGPVDMNSFNHYAYGAVGDWMFAHLGGLQILESGYKKVRIHPLFESSGLQYSRCALQTSYGLLSAEWTRSDSELILDVSIPVNTSAQIVLPAGNEQSVREGDYLAMDAPGVRTAELRDGELILLVGSGQYRFNVR